MPRTTGKTTEKRTSSKKKTGTSKRKPDKRALAKKKKFFSDETKVILAGLLGLFLFLSNFGILGALGKYVSAVELGLFGMTGYVFPVLLLLAVVLYVRNRGTFLAGLKLVCLLLLVVILSALAELLFGSDEISGIKALYAAGAAGKLCGGAVGGTAAAFLKSFAGTVGAYLILAALLIICMVFVTERSFVSAARNGAERTAQAAKEGQERAREAALTYREQRAERRAERALRREERIARGVDLPSTDLELNNADEAEASRIERERIANTAELYADFGKELIEGQPGLADVDDGTGHGEIHNLTDFTASSAEEDDGRYDTQILPRPELYTGHIESVPDYSVDTVPFEENPDPEVYKAYRYGSSGNSYGSSGNGGDSRDGLAASDAASLSPSASMQSGSPVPDKTSDFSFEISEGRSFGEWTEPLDTDAALPSGIDTDGQDIFDSPLTDNSSPASFAGISAGSSDKTRLGVLDTDAASRTVTASGKELAGVSPEAAALLKQKAAGKIDRIDTGEEQKRAAFASGQKTAAASPEENRAVAEEIRRKTAKKRPYVFPPLQLLKKGPKTAASNQTELRETAAKLQQVLHTFGVGVKVTNVSMGPAVTRYELQPDIGVKVSRITSLSDDIKLALAAADIRIEAPIPGKSAVGIEVPNKDKSTVYFRDIIDTPEFRDHPSRLAFAIGRDIAGKTVVGDIAKMPHLLIAGATGSGKSVGINTLIMSLIYKSSPEDVRMIMVDPKVVELSVYNGIPHLLIPVVTDPKKAASALNWAVAEMMDRYKRFAEAEVRDLKGYNRKAEEVRRKLAGRGEEDKLPKKMPQIVIIIDELADLMMVASKEVEDAIVRLTQLARAAGLHLVIATQRPSVNVITGLIKANVPSRIAFQTSSGVDSRTIIDMNGAEKLMGSGDMLYYPSGASKPSRVQGSFISDGEVQAVVDFLTKHGEADYSEEIGTVIEQQTLEGTGGGNNQEPKDDRDAYFADAARLIVEKDKASIGMLQRMYKIGFNRAARLMDQLGEAGVVGPEEGTKPRRILMNAAELEAYLQDAKKS